ncbi:unnamed protein product [Nippostrongylus brasiliensis]|uniref:Transmembrane protein n=1 Tax=Nippostrongylus brasiliensis TaxID=27835 RepID=A0A0N4YI42_NIPBR|nr:unnamed protein product [Nippostrongylus brasiliensis]
MEIQVQFNELLGLNPDLYWRNGTVLNQQINKLLAMNTTELVKVCNARTQFYQCLGTSYYACMNLFNILDTSDPDFTNAFDYTRTYIGLEFMCNAGFEGEFDPSLLVEVVTQWTCLYSVQTTKGYTDCMNKFTYNVAPANFCNLVDQTGQCLSAAYMSSCADKGAAWYGCENFRFTFDQTCWGLRCNVPQN